jgi:hypothetical protein
MKKEMKRIDIDLPHGEYGYLKLMCHKLNMSIKDFCTKKIIEAVDEEEDNLWADRLEKRIAEADPSDFIEWDEMKKLAGWDV